MPGLSAEQRERIEQQLSLCARARELLPGRRAPYHAHVRLRSAAGKESDVLLGDELRAGPAGVSIIDFRTAPLAEVFFAHAEGEPYELDLGDRLLEGTVVQRNLVSFEQGEPVEIRTAAALLSRRGGEWHALPLPALPALLARPQGAQGRPTSPVDVELDPAQRAVVELPPRRAVLVLGEAGCGKTTVALHRLRRVWQLRRGRVRAAVIVPTEGLRLLVESLLDRLGLEGVDALTYDRFAQQQARRAFPDLPRRESQDAPAGVLQLKRHEAVRVALAELAARSPARPEEGKEPRRAAKWARREDLHALFGDRALLDRIVAASGGAVTAGAAADVFAHARAQFRDTAEEEFAHVSAEAKQTVDGRGLDEGTPNETARTVDIEDYAVMFELERLRAGRRGVEPLTPRQYDCLVLDEAQELAPLELALVGRSVAPGGTLIVAGDAAQQVDEAACFRGWDAAMHELGAREHTTAVLEISYRCPPAVTSFARGLREPAGAVALPIDDALALAPFDDECHLAAWLADALRDLAERDPTTAVAIVCRTPFAATGLQRVLGHAVDARLSLGGRFVFGPGTQVTSVQEVKGLEFDHVVVPDVTWGRYPDSPSSRRALYVAATRASAQLVLACAGKASPLVSSGR